MADFCNWYGSFCGCGEVDDPSNPYYSPCPPDCVCDFTEDAREASKWLPEGHVTDLGCCEGHATAVSLVKLNGKFFIQHAVPWPPCDD